MFQDLDDSLQALLTTNLPTSLAGQVEISFAAPDDQFQPSSTVSLTINLFLYDIRENLDLRSQEWIYQRQTSSEANEAERPQATKIAPPVRVDCSYLITTWSSQANAKIRDEHYLLGTVMQTLLKYRTLPDSVLVGTMASQDLPLPTATLQASQLQSFSEFWQALGGKPKAALNYTVTISVPVNEPETSAPLVERREFEVKPY